MQESNSNQVAWPLNITVERPFYRVVFNGPALKKTARPLGHLNFFDGIYYVIWHLELSGQDQ